MLSMLTIFTVPNTIIMHMHYELMSTYYYMHPMYIHTNIAMITLTIYLLTTLIPDVAKII